MSDHLLNFVKLSQKICLSRYTIYKMMNDENFPKARKIGKASRWINSEVEAWMEALPTAALGCQDCSTSDL